MARPKGQPKLGGREKGTPNRVSEETKRLAQRYSRDAIVRLAELITKGETHTVQVAACREILDRGLGKAVQQVDISTTGEHREIRIIEIVGTIPGQLPQPAQAIDITPEADREEVK